VIPRGPFQPLPFWDSVNRLPLIWRIYRLSPNFFWESNTQLARILQMSLSPASVIRAVAFPQVLPSTRHFFALVDIYSGLTRNRGYCYFAFYESFISGTKEAIFFLWFTILPDLGPAAL